MKILKKIVAIASICSMVASFAVTASAKFSDLTAVTSANEIEAGGAVTIDADWDSLVDAKGAEIHIYYDTNAFEVKSGDNTTYNFGNPIIPDYLPAYISDDFVAARYRYVVDKQVDNFNVATVWSTFSKSATTGAVNYVFSDASNTAITSTYESLATHSKIGANFVAKSDAVAGTYTFNIKMIVSDINVGDIEKTAAVSVKIKGSDPEPDPTPTTVEAVAGKTIENGYKTFSAPAPAVLATSAENLITVTKSGDTERKLTHALPAGVAGGKTKVLPIVSYKLGVNGVNAADVFTITITSGSDTIATYTYTAQ